MRHFFRLSGSILTLGLLLPFAAQVLAASPAKKPAAPKAVPADKQAAPKQKTDAAYEQWLKKFGAYDRITPVGEDEEPGSAGDLKRAEAHLMQGAPQQALAVIESLPPYEDAALESQRLWLGAQAFRALGDPHKAVMLFSQSAARMDPKALKARLGSEPGLEALWVDVFRRQYWAYVATPSASRDALELTLRTLLAQAETAWGLENFWLKSKEVLAQASGEPAETPAKAPAPKDASAKDALVIGDAQRLIIAKSLAQASLEGYDDALASLGGLREPALKDFWGSFVSFLRTGKPGDTKALNASGHAKAAGFWNANLMAPFSGNREEWLLGNTTAQSWLKFRNNLMQLPTEDALEAVDKEMQSLLLSEDMARLLRSAKFILYVQSGDLDSAKELWGALDKRKLPVTLRLAGGILYQEDVKNLLPTEIGAASRLGPALSALYAAAGLGSPVAGEAPFWTRMEVGRSSSVNKVWPLDRLLVIADWQARWAAAPGPELARRSAFLFPETAFGYDCLAYLAKNAIEERYFQLAGTYLTRMGAVAADKRQQALRLSLKAKMERESGRDDEALASYQEMIALGRDIDPKARLDMATFLQLKNDFAGAKKQLLALWEQRETMPKPLQAEILFWLGEGEHSQKNYDAALDYYLQLAYQYSKESMWPTVAMYRASMIYELKGKYDAARKFLNAVIATAERKEEREAARNRLNALEAKAGKIQPSTGTTQEMVYPF